MAKALLASQETQAMSTQVIDRYRNELVRLHHQYSLHPVKVQELYEKQSHSETKKLLDNDMVIAFKESGNPHFVKREAGESTKMRARLNPSGFLDDLVTMAMDDYTLSLPIPEQDPRESEMFSQLDSEVYQNLWRLLGKKSQSTRREERVDSLNPPTGMTQT